MSRTAPVCVLCYYPPVRFSIVFSHIRNAPCLRRGSGNFFLASLCDSVPGPFSRWYIARLALDRFALVSTSDAAPSSFVPRFQPSGYSSLFFASSRVPVCSDFFVVDEAVISPGMYAMLSVIMLSTIYWYILSEYDGFGNFTCRYDEIQLFFILFRAVYS